MAYQVTSKTSYGQRLKSSFGGIGMGFILLILGTCLLWWNEGRAVKTSKMLKSAESVAVHVADVSTVDAANDGKLIHATAVAQTSEALTDASYGVSAVALQLERKVEFYQWTEHSSSQTKDKVGGSQETVTTYTYSKEWTSGPVNSADFKDPDYQASNSVFITPSSESWQAQNVSFGAYRLPSNMVSSLSCNTPVEITPDEAVVNSLNEDISKFKGDTVTTEYVHVNGNVIYIGRNSDAPEIGDVRITYTKTDCGEVSVLAQVAGDTFTNYTAPNGKTLSAIVPGTRSMDEMFQSEHQTNKIWLWVFRIVGILLVIGGLKGIFNILVTLLKVLPFLAKIGNLGVGLVCNVVGFIWSLIVILIAWIAYRPIVAIVLLAVVVALVVFLVRKSKNAKAVGPAKTE